MPGYKHNCKFCGQLVDADANVCPYCGKAGPVYSSCPYCKAPFEPGFAVCSKCGKPLVVPCPKCGTYVQPEFDSCPKCGNLIRHRCKACRVVVSQGDRRCPRCGTKLVSFFGRRL